MGSGPTTKGFLLWDYIDDLSICDRIIDFHKNSNEKKIGLTISGYQPEIKDSTDVRLSPDCDFGREYVSQLQKVADEYIKTFPFSNCYAPWTVIEGISVQHYAPPDQAFKSWHTERCEGVLPNAARHLVFMTYLNDVHDGGETEWHHQGVKLSPRKGLTAIWPADWTYTHRGCVSKTEHKYVITGWYSFYPKVNLAG